MRTLSNEALKSLQADYCPGIGLDLRFRAAVDLSDHRFHAVTLAPGAGEVQPCGQDIRISLH